MKKLGERIYKHREACGLSQLEFAEMLDVSHQAVSKWENGTAVPELGKLIKMSEIFSISLDELVLGKVHEASPDSESAPTYTKEGGTEEIKPSKEKSLAKTVMGCFFIAFGAVICMLFMFWAPLLGFLLIFPFGLSAFFCLKQLRCAALWCMETWFVFISLYLASGSGTKWHLIFYPGLYSPNTNRMLILLSWLEFVLIGVFTLITVLCFRRSDFIFSNGKHITLAAISGGSLILSVVSSALFSFITLYLLFGGDKVQYAYWLREMDNVIPIIELAVSYIFIAVFTVCVLPTLSWIKRLISNRNS